MFNNSELLVSNNFKSLIKGDIKTKEDFIRIRKKLSKYGVNKLYDEIPYFENGFTSTKDPFARMLAGELLEQFIDFGDFILISPPNNPDHKLLTPKIREWQKFNVLTLTFEDIPLLEYMKKTAMYYVDYYNVSNYGLFFHCYPYNSVYCLHLHIVDLDREPKFQNKRNNLKIDDVISVLKIEALNNSILMNAVSNKSN